MRLIMSLMMIDQNDLQTFASQEIRITGCPENFECIGIPKPNEVKREMIETHLRAQEPVAGSGAPMEIEHSANRMDEINRIVEHQGGKVIGHTGFPRLGCR